MCIAAYMPIYANFGYPPSPTGDFELASPERTSTEE
jgi:hypothetical protein